MVGNGQKSLNITWPLVALAAVTAAAIVGIYWVSAGPDRASVLGVLSPVCSAIVAAFLARKVGTVESKVDEIHDNTNGRLDARIERAVTRALDGRR